MGEIQKPCPAEREEREREEREKTEREREKEREWEGEKARGEEAEHVVTDGKKLSHSSFFNEFFLCFWIDVLDDVALCEKI